MAIEAFELLARKASAAGAPAQRPAGAAAAPRALLDLAAGKIPGAPGAPGAQAAPVTPKAADWEALPSFSPPGAPRTPDFPSLLAAMRTDSVEDVRAALEEDPSAARDLFWEHGATPPLCWAVRHGSDPSVVRLLLEHDADVHAMDADGKTPLSILGSQPCPKPRDLRLWEPPRIIEPWPLAAGALWDSCPPPFAFLAAEAAALEPERRREEVRRCLEISELLLAAGADPEMEDGAGERPADLADAHGKCHLLRRWRGCRDIDAALQGDLLDKLGVDDSEFGALPW